MNVPLSALYLLSRASPEVRRGVEQHFAQTGERPTGQAVNKAVKVIWETTTRAISPVYVSAGPVKSTVIDPRAYAWREERDFIERVRSWTRQACARAPEERAARLPKGERAAALEAIREHAAYMGAWARVLEDDNPKRKFLSDSRSHGDKSH